MIKVNFNAYDSYVTDSLYQWDLNQILTINGLNLVNAPEIHFSNANMDRAIVRQSTMTNHVISVNIPNSLLQVPLTIKVNIGIYEGDIFKVIEKILIPVIPKTRPSDYQIQDSDEEIYSFKRLENEIVNAKKNIEEQCNDNLAEMEKTVDVTNAMVRTQIANIITHNNNTEGNTELLDIRTGANGLIYDSAGEAVRKQLSKLSTDMVDEIMNSTRYPNYVDNTNDYNTLKGYYEKTSGIFIENNSCTSTKINVLTGEQFCITASYGANTAVICEFDENDKFIRSILKGDKDGQIADYEYTVPNGVAKVAFTSYPNYTVSLIIKQKDTLKNNIDILKLNMSNISKSLKAEYLISDVNIPLELEEKTGYAYDSSWSDPNYKIVVSQKIPIYYGQEVILTSTNYKDNIKKLIVFDENDTLLYAENASTNLTYPNVIEDTYFISDKNAKYAVLQGYVRVSVDIEEITGWSFKYKHINPYVEKLVNEKNSNVLYGKKYVACGDSYTEGDFRGFADENGLSGTNSPVIYDSDLKMYKTYPWWIAKRNGMTLINEAKCGSTMALSKEYTSGQEGYDISHKNPFSYKRYLEVPTDADYITLMFGLNEASIPIGNLSDTTNETIIGAWNVVIKHFLTNMPYAKIGIIIPDAWLSQELHDAIISVSEYWGIPYLDLKGDPKIPLMAGGRLNNIVLNHEAKSLRDNAFYVADSNHHPNIKAHEYRSTVIENFLRSL